VHLATNKAQMCGQEAERPRVSNDVTLFVSCRSSLTYAPGNVARSLSVFPMCTNIRRRQLHGIDINDRRTVVVRASFGAILNTSGMFGCAHLHRRRTQHAMVLLPVSKQ